MAAAAAAAAVDRRRKIALLCLAVQKHFIVRIYEFVREEFREQDDDGYFSALKWDFYAFVIL